MKEIEDITEAAQILSEIYEKLKEINEDAKEYLDEFIEESDFESINDYEKCVDSLDDKFEVRIYDLAQYNLTNRLISKINKL
tara:strand:+ start:159 stop:404 length:246 start_codon:yes stop_codon:yes gene_type:complete